MTVRVLEATKEVPAFEDEGLDPALAEYYQNHLDRAAVAAMADQLRRLVTITVDPPNDVTRTVLRRYSIAVGDLDDQAKFNEAVERRAQQLAAALFYRARDRAIESIDMWGSHFGRTIVTKDDAKRFVREAFCTKEAGE